MPVRLEPGSELGLTPASLRRANERTLIDLLTRMRRASRADLAKASGLSQPTTGKIVQRLVRRGAIREVQPALSNGFRFGDPGEGVAVPGRPGRLVEFDPQTPRFLAVHLDVTDTSLALLPFHPHCPEQWPVRFPTGKGLERWLRELSRHRPVTDPGSLWRVVVSVPGIVDEREGRVIFSPNVHWTERTRLVQALESLWQLPVEVVQEIGALALGHLMHEPDHRDFLLVDVGEGLGGAIVIHGRPFANPLPLHGELGHTPIPGNPRRCGCGGVGCLETLLSRRSLLDSFSASGAPGPHGWKDLAVRIRTEGLPPWLDGTLAAAGAVIAGALNILGLRRVVVTGLLGDLPTAATERLFQAIRRGGLWARFGEIDCLAAPRRRAAGLVAAGIDLFSSASSPGQGA
ncbi:MAG: ROK family protein [Verrucomicrobiae bacterium]|nr:ROK family protein [Verrucomicrobiae bacterium]MCP5520255.1 ROK family protein [Verrucomicrobiales bacterium]